METMLCSVSGMQNKENKTQVKNALKKIEGVSQVGVNLTSGTVKLIIITRRRKTPQPSSVRS